MSDLLEETHPVEEPTKEELDDFKARVSEWTKLDDQVRKLNIAIRERRVHQKALAEGIQSFMSKYGYDNLNTNQGRIIHNVRKVKTPIKISEIRDILHEKNNLTGEQLLKEIFEKDRPVVEKKSIRRVIPKVSMHLEL
jgi:hypothetical protein